MTYHTLHTYTVAHHYACVDVSDCSVDWRYHLYHRSPLCMLWCFIRLVCRL